MEIKKPRKPTLFDIGPGFPARQIVQISCGGMHTVALASDGSVYTWGCNDEGALGRPGAENLPLKVNLEIPVNGISAGDSHTIAYNTSTNQVFYWGCYRVSNLLSNAFIWSQVPGICSIIALLPLFDGINQRLLWLKGLA
jgi:alpha-tubulin suppressor-like RCC1 family protein